MMELWQSLPIFECLENVQILRGLVCLVFTSIGQTTARQQTRKQICEIWGDVEGPEESSR